MKKYAPALVVLLLFALVHQVLARSLDSDLSHANQLMEKIPVSEIMGPLAPVALSPFFGLTCLSGISLLGEQGMMPANRFISNNALLNSQLAFGVLLLLTLVTSIPKFSKVSKPFAQIVDQMEAYAGIVAYAAILVASNLASPPPEEVTVVYTAGFMSFSGETLLLIVAAINIFVINTVKFLFEVLTFISPIPAIDALFELLNKVVVAVLMFIYSLSPAIAFGLNIIIFLCALCLFSWARRWVKYFREVVLFPAINLVRGKLKQDTFSLDRKKVPPKLRIHLREGTQAIKAFPLLKQGKWKKRQLSYLFVTGDSCVLARHQLLKEPMSMTYIPETYTAELEGGLLTNRVTFIDREKGDRIPVVFSRQYDKLMDDIAAIYRIDVPQNAFEKLTAVSSIRQLLRGSDRSGLQAEMK